MSSALLTVPQAADRLAISTRQVKRLLATHELGCVRIGRSVRIGEQHLAAFLAANDKPAIAAVIALHPAGTGTPRARTRRVRSYSA